MGNFKHHAIVVTGSADEPDIVESHAIATRTFAALSQFSYAMVTPIQVAPNQGWASFAVLPDGAKEGHDPSVAADEARAAFLEQIKTRDVDFVEVAFGGDNADVHTRVERHSGQDDFVEAWITVPPKQS